MKTHGLPIDDAETDGQQFDGHLFGGKWFSAKICNHSAAATELNTNTKSKAKNTDAGWSSLVARQAHNLKVLGSNPSPATKKAR